MQLLKHVNKWLGIIIILSFSKIANAQDIVGKQAPSLVVENQQGNKVSLSDLQGKFVLLNFWGSWCPESVVKLPILNNLKQQNSDANPGFEVFNVALDDNTNAWLKACSENNQSGVYQFIDRAKFESYYVYDFGVNKLPASFLISPDGIVLERDPTSAQIESYLTKGATSSDQAYTTYKVLLGTFGSLNYHNGFAHLSHLGPVNPNETENGEYKVWIGPFADFTSAQYAEQEVKKKGYKEAIIDTEIGDTPAILPTNTYPLPDDSTPAIVALQKDNALVVNESSVTKPAFTPPPAAVTPRTPTLVEKESSKDSQFVVQPPSPSNEKLPSVVTNFTDNAPLPNDPWDTSIMPIEVPKVPDVYDPYKGESVNPWEKGSAYNPTRNSPNELYNDIANNPKVQKRIHRLEARKKTHDNKAQKIDTKIRDIEQKEVIKGLYGKSRK